jgi:hypothetical protein
VAGAFPVRACVQCAFVCACAAFCQQLQPHASRPAIV